MISLLFGFATLYFLVSKICYSGTSLNLPCGPLNLPLIGNIQWLATFPRKHFSKYGKLYGPIAHLKMGKTRAFLLNDVMTWKAAYSQAELSRHPGKVFESTLKNKSVIFGNGNPEIKHFMIKALNDFGKDSLENLALKEISICCQRLLKTNGRPIAIESLFPIPTVNVLWTLLLGKRIEESDQSLHDFAEIITTMSNNSSFLGRESMLFLIPYARKLFPSKSRNESIQNILLKWTNVIKEKIEERVRNRQKFEVSNITDAYFDKVEQTDPNSNSFFAGDNSIHFVYMGLFMAGADSTSTSLEWLILFVATNPLVKKRFRDEIENIIGNRAPSLIDRQRMPYALAVIEEMFRLSVISITQFRQAKEDTKLLGYDIPKGSILIPNVYAINRDPKVWLDPENFRPERFINADGKFQKSDRFNTFGYGKRSCIGETIARNQIFLFATSIFQQFDVKIYGDIPPLNGNFGFLHHPKRYKVCFEKMNNNV